jgi:UDP-2,3-diacylglucosamine hydrolase
MDAVPGPMPLTAQFFSDLHIQREDDPRAVLFLEILKKLVGRSSHLFLVGDVFDLWIADRPYFQRRYAKIVEALQILRDTGTEIHMFEGNHDIHFGEFWRDEFKVNVHQNSWHTQLGPWQVRIEHGDLMNPDDTSYRLLRWFLRTPPVRWFGHSVSGEFIAGFADPWSRHSRKASLARESAAQPVGTMDEQAKARADRIRAMMHAFATRTALERPTDLIITGHTHVQDDFLFRSAQRTCRFINLGSWFDLPCYFELTEAGGAWRSVERVTEK